MIGGERPLLPEILGQKSRSQRKVMYHQQKRYNIQQWIGSATSNLAFRRSYSGKRAGVARSEPRAASSCNAFAIATFSS